MATAHRVSVRRLAAMSATTLLVSVMVIAAVTRSVTPAAAVGPQVTVMYPLSGTLSSSPLENPPHHHFWGNFAIDDAAPAGSAVYAQFAHPTGALSLSLGGTFEPCGVARSAGSGLIVNVFIDGQHVGSVRYAHLTGITRTSGAINNGDQIATLWNGGQTKCWSGPHTHVEPGGSGGAACFLSRALNTAVGSSDALGVIGGGYATADNQTCPPGVENGGSPPSITPPLTVLGEIDNGTFYAKVGLAGTWVAESGNATAIAVASDSKNGPLLGVITNGTFYAKIGSLTAPWVAESGNATAISVASDTTNGPLLGVIANGTFYAKEGSLTATGIPESGNATAISVASDTTNGPLLGVVANGSFYAKEGSLTATGIPESGNATAISVAG